MSYNEWQAFNLVILIALMLHLYLHYSNPGFIVTQSAAFNFASYCEKCCLRRDDKAGHCPVCGFCVAERDHHCFWIDNCIGMNNHRIFLIYLIWLLGILVYSGLKIFTKLNNLQCGGLKCLLEFCYLRDSSAFLMVVLVQIVPLIFYLGILLIQQIVFISIGRTQQELYRMSQNDYRFSLILFVSSNLTFKSLINNWAAFFCIRLKFRHALVVNENFL